MTKIPTALPLLTLLAAPLTGVTTAQNTVTWDGTCLGHPTSPSNLWNARCLFPPDLDDFTNWDTNLFPGRTDHVVIPAGIPGGVRIFDAFSSLSATINSASPLLIDGGGPVSMLDPTGVSNIADLTLTFGQLTVAHQLVVSGDCSMAEGIVTNEFGDPDGGHLIINDNFTVTGLPPNPFARTALFIKRVENLGNVDFSGSVSSDIDSIIDNRGTWTFVDSSTYGSNTAEFVNHANATLKFDVATPGGTVYLASRLNSTSATVDHRRGTLVLTAEGNLIRSSQWSMGPGTRLAIDSGFPDFGIPAGTLEWNGRTLEGPAGGGATLEIREHATLVLPRYLNRTLHGVSLVNHGNVQQGVSEITPNLDAADLTLTAGASFTNAATGNYRQFRGALIFEGNAVNEGTVDSHGRISVRGDTPFENRGTLTGSSTITGKSRDTTALLNTGTFEPGRGSGYGNSCEINSATIINEGTTSATHPIHMSRATLRQTAGTLTCQSIYTHSFEDNASIDIAGGTFITESNSGVEIEVDFNLSTGDVELNANATTFFGGGNCVGNGTISLRENSRFRITGEPLHFDGEYTIRGDAEVQFGITYADRVRLNSISRSRRRGDGDLFIDGGRLTIDVTGERLLSSPDRYLVNRSTLTIADGATLAVQSPPILVNSKTINLHGDITMPAGSKILNGDPTGEASSQARILVSSKIGETNQIPHTIDNPDRFEIIATENSTVVLSGDVIQANRASGVLDDGEWIAKNGSSLDIQGLTLADLSASIKLFGTGQFLPLRRSDNLQNNRSFSLEEDAAYTHDGFWDNNSLLRIKQGCSLTVTGQFETNDRSNIILDGTLSVAEFDNDGGRFSGSGTINAQSFNNDGELNPGSSPGTLTINSPFTQSSIGTLTIEINGPDPGTTHDQLVVSGTATLGGTLSICLAPGFHPAPGQTFEILNAASLTGTFDRIDTGATGNRTTFTPTYAGGTVTLTAAPATYPDYATWRTAKFDPVDAADPLVSGPGADPDGDRIPNALEYASALRPTKHDTHPYSFRTDPSSPQVIDALLPVAADATGITPAFQSSADLRNWIPVASTLTETLPASPTSLPVRVYRVSLPTGDSGFIRVSGAE